MSEEKHPTRDQIAAALWRVSLNPAVKVTWNGTPPWMLGYNLKLADAVLALFPQPTPTAEPEEEVESCPECGGLGYDVDWADPPTQGPCGACGGSGNLDPSTIRDVTPPESPNAH